MSGPSRPEPAVPEPAVPEPAVPEPDRPEAEPSDAERRSVIDRVQQAMAEDLIAFEQVEARFEEVYAATSRAELDRVAADLPALHRPPPPPSGRHLAPRSHLRLIGDVKIGGWLTVDDRVTVTGGIGDVTVDLSSASFGPGGATVLVRLAIGDVKVIVPDGARVQIEATVLIGDERHDLSPPMDDGPVIRIKGLQLLGDLEVYSLSLVPEGRLRRLWASLRRER